MDSSQNRSEGGRGRGRLRGKVTPAIKKIRLATKIVRKRSGRGRGEVTPAITPATPMTRPSIRPVSPDITDPAGYRLDMPKVNRPPPLLMKPQPLQLMTPQPLHLMKPPPLLMKPLPLDGKTPSAQKEQPAAEKTNTLARRTRSATRVVGSDLELQENLSDVTRLVGHSLDEMTKMIPNGPISPDITKNELVSEGPSAQKELPAPEKTDTMARRTRSDARDAGLDLELQRNSSDVTRLFGHSLDNMTKMIPNGPISPDRNENEFVSEGPSSQKELPAPEKTDTMAKRTRSAFRDVGSDLASQENLSGDAVLDGDGLGKIVLRGMGRERGKGRGRGKPTPAIKKIRLATKIVRKRSGRGRGRGRGEVTPAISPDKPMTRPSVRPLSPDITEHELTTKEPSPKKELPAAESTGTMVTRTRRSCRLASQENLSSVALSDRGSLENMKKTARGGTKNKTLNEECETTPKCETLRKGPARNLEEISKTEYVPSSLMYDNSLNPSSGMCVNLKMMDQVRKDEEAYHEAKRESRDKPVEQEMAPVAIPECIELDGAAVEVELESPELGRAAFLRALQVLEELDRADVERATLDLPIFLLERMLLDLRRDNTELEGETRAQQTRIETLSALVNSPENPGSSSSTPVVTLSP